MEFLISIIQFILIFILLLVLYTYYIVPDFAYLGFYSNPDLYKVFTSILLLISFPIFMSIFKVKNVTYKTLFNGLIVFSFIPALVLFSSEEIPFLYILYIYIAFFLILLVAKLNLKKLFLDIKIDISKFTITTFMLSALVLLYLLSINFNYFNLNFEKVYEYRLILNKETPDFLRYLTNILFKGLYPLLYLYFIFHMKSKTIKVFIILYSVFIYILLFGITSHKTFLFLILALTFFSFLFNIWKTSNFYSLLILTIFILIYIVNLVNKNLAFILNSLIIRRVFIVPADLNFKYFDFFNKHPFVFFSDSNFLPIKVFYSYPYDLGVPFIIGKNYFGNELMSANTGFLGSGYAHAGLVGILIYSIILGLILKYLSLLSRYVNWKFIVLSFFPYLFILNSSDLKTILITHGLILYLLLITIIAYYEKRKCNYLFFNKRAH